MVASQNYAFDAYTETFSSGGLAAGGLIFAACVALGLVATYVNLRPVWRARVVGEVESGLAHDRWWRTNPTVYLVLVATLPVCFVAIDHALVLARDVVGTPRLSETIALAGPAILWAGVALWVPLGVGLAYRVRKRAWAVRRRRMLLHGSTATSRA